jgi:hypothetical protein
LRDDLFQRFQSNVRQTDGFAAALIHQTFQRSPGIEQSDLAIVDDVAEYIARILIITRLKSERRVDQVAVDKICLQALAARLESRFDPLGAVVGVPQFGGDEHVFAANLPSGEYLLKGHADLASLRYRSAQSKWRKPTSRAHLTASVVVFKSRNKVPKPTAGIEPAPLFSGQRVSRSAS